MSKLEGKVAVITGGNSGIGYSTAEELKRQGSRVVITGRSKERVNAAAADLGVDGFVADVSKLSDINNLVVIDGPLLFCRSLNHLPWDTLITARESLWALTILSCRVNDRTLSTGPQLTMRTGSRSHI